MPFFNNPSDFFIGGILRQDLEYVAGVMKCAKEAGYERVVEPCAGQMPISRVASKIGFKKIEASDITIFSGILGRYAEGRGIEDMMITSTETGEVLSDPFDVLYLLKRKQLMSDAGNAYGENMLIDYDKRSEEIKKNLKSQLDMMKQELSNFTYADMDMFDHIDAVFDDEKTIVVCNAPGYKGGYEKYYKPLTDAVVWNEPKYEMFDARWGYEGLMEHVENAKCLFLLVEDAEVGHPTRKALYARPAGRIGYNAYVVSNRPDEVKKITGLSIARKNGEIEFGKYLIAQKDFVPKECVVVHMNARQISYYRQIIGHSNDGTRGYGIIGDGYLMGVFGYLPVQNGDVKLSFASGNMDVITREASKLKTMKMEFNDIDMSKIKTFNGGEVL